MSYYEKLEMKAIYMIWYDKKYEVMWCDVAWREIYDIYDVIWYDIWCDTIRYDMI